MKQKIIPILIVLTGFLLLFYPFTSNYLFEKSAGSTVESYQEKAAGMDQAIIKKVMDEAKQYNGELMRSSVQLTDPFKEKRLDGETVHYNRILNIDGSSIMGYLKIPCISLNLPIYHGTSGTVLEHGIGHLAASSFPIGGKDTHAVLTGHTGLSSAKIFTDLTEMKKGDFFFIHVLDKKLAYLVDQITVVEPQDTKELQIMEGKDHVTLVTCTPYGVNDKRLLVRGVRTAYHAKEEEIRARNHHSQWMEVYKRAIFAGLLIICVLIAARKVYEKMKTHQVTKEDIAQKVGPANREEIQILLAHNPEYMEAYQAWGSDITLSGHLHGGLICLPNGKSVITPQFHLFPKHAGEMKVKGNQTAIVSRGLGTHTVNIRLFNPAELIVFQISKQ